MLEALRVALVQMTSPIGAVGQNVAKACDLLHQAREVHGADVAVLPEFFNTGYFPVYWDYQYMRLAETDRGQTIATLRKVAVELQITILAPFYEEEAPGLYFNTVAIIGKDGELSGKYRKTHPPARLSLEKIYYKRGSRLPLFSIEGWRAGIMVCYDTFYPEVARCLTVGGAEIIYVPFANDPMEQWNALLTTRAFENGVYLAVCNKVGRESDDNPRAVFGGLSAIVDPRGRILSQAGPDREEIVCADISWREVCEVRRERQWLRDRRPELYSPLARFEEDVRGMA
jgi:N-carbamoylputrescine amidase